MNKHKQPVSKKIQFLNSFIYLSRYFYIICFWHYNYIFTNNKNYLKIFNRLISFILILSFIVLPLIMPNFFDIYLKSCIIFTWLIFFSSIVGLHIRSCLSFLNISYYKIRKTTDYSFKLKNYSLLKLILYSLFIFTPVFNIAILLSMYFYYKNKK